MNINFKKFVIAGSGEDYSEQTLEDNTVYLIVKKDGRTLSKKVFIDAWNGKIVDCLELCNEAMRRTLSK